MDKCSKNKPLLPKNIKELDVQFMLNEEKILPITNKTNIKNMVIKLSKKYFFERIPDEWISIEKANDNIDTSVLENDTKIIIPNIEKKQLLDLTITKELNNYNKQDIVKYKAYTQQRNYQSYWSNSQNPYDTPHTWKRSNSSSCIDMIWIKTYEPFNDPSILMNILNPPSLEDIERVIKQLPKNKAAGPTTKKIPDKWKILEEKIRNFNLLKGHNFAAEKYTSTITPIQILNNTIEHVNQHKITFIHFFQDMSKAFDNVDHQRLKIALKCIEQGDPLSPIIWKIFYDPILAHITNNYETDLLTIKTTSLEQINMPNNHHNNKIHNGKLIKPTKPNKDSILINVHTTLSKQTDRFISTPTKTNINIPKENAKCISNLKIKKAKNTFIWHIILMKNYLSIATSQTQLATTLINIHNEIPKYTPSNKLICYSDGSYINHNTDTASSSFVTSSKNNKGDLLNKQADKLAKEGHNIDPITYNYDSIKNFTEAKWNG
ncbi:14901_t:CDS:10, partial [Entrophospora sp. SA101]